jgi:hypothetical protein
VTPFGARDKQAFLWAFDLLALGGEDLRDLPLERRKGELESLLKRAPFGLALNDYVAGTGGRCLRERLASRQLPWRRLSERPGDRVNRLCLRDYHAVREALVGFQRSILQKIRDGAAQIHMNERGR